MPRYDYHHTIFLFILFDVTMMAMNTADWSYMIDKKENIQRENPHESS